jgi:hypothetical protein
MSDAYRQKISVKIYINRPYKAKYATKDRENVVQQDRNSIAYLCIASIDRLFCCYAIPRTILQQYKGDTHGTRDIFRAVAVLNMIPNQTF